MRRTLIVLLIALLSAACTAKPDAAIPSRVLESWQPEEDTLTKSDTMRAWRFNGQQGDEVRLRLAAKASGQVSLALQDDDGKTLAQGGDVNFTLPTDGLYTALVQLVKGSDTIYSLTLSYANQSVPTATITPSDTPTATLTPTPTFTPSDTPTATLTPTPVYSALGTLTGHLEIDQAVDGGYLSAFERHIYLFSGSAGQQVTISMVATSGSVDPTLTLYDPSGQPMATDDNSGGGSAALLRDILLPVDGEYVVQALGGGTGSYRISLQATAPTPDQPTVTPTPPLGTVTPVAGADALSDHIPVVDMIDRHDAFKRYFIDAHAGDILTLSVHPVDGSTLKPRLDIYTPEGELMVSTGLDRSGQAQIPGLGVIEDGRYAVFVTADGRTGGAYILSFGFGSTNSDVLRGALAPETAAAGSSLSATRDEWTLLLSIGDVVDLEAPGAVLQVVAPDGSNVVQAGDRAQFNATESGAYRLYASGGRYTLLWHYLIAAPTAQAPVTILSADDPLPAQTYLYYPFQAMSGLHVHIRVEALNDGVDPVAALLDSSGATVATGDDSPGTLNPDFGALLPADGTYMLRVNDYNNAGGSVRVSVQLSS